MEIDIWPKGYWRGEKFWRIYFRRASSIIIGWICKTCLRYSTKFDGKSNARGREIRPEQFKIKREAWKNLEEIISINKLEEEFGSKIK